MMITCANKAILVNKWFLPQYVQLRGRGFTPHGIYSLTASIQHQRQHRARLVPTSSVVSIVMHAFFVWELLRSCKMNDVMLITKQYTTDYSSVPCWLDRSYSWVHLGSLIVVENSLIKCFSLHQVVAKHQFHQSCRWKDQASVPAAKSDGTRRSTCSPSNRRSCHSQSLPTNICE